MSDNTPPNLASALERIELLEKNLKKQKKINSALMKRVEENIDSHGNAFSLFQTASSLELEVRERTAQLEATMRELTSTNRRLEDTLKDLECSQHRMIQAEKMAALGQLIAGIAHEINTPLGVVRSSIQNIDQSLHYIFTKALKRIKLASPENMDFLFEILNFSTLDRTALSSRDARQKRKKFSKILHECSVEDADNIADMFVDMGIDNAECIETLIGYFHMPGWRVTLEAASHLLQLKLNAKNINLSVDRASKVVFALKTFTHQDSTPQKTFTDINEDLNTVLTLYSNQIRQGVELHTELSTLPKLFCYADELNQVWTNLIFNALQAMENNGELTIKTHASDASIVVVIKDNGPGIPKEVQPKIFETFFTTKQAGSGTGLGLSIVRDIVHKHEGTIHFESCPGRTAFFVSIPFSEENINENH